MREKEDKHSELRELAKNGDADAQHALGFIYFNEKDDMEEAAKMVTNGGKVGKCCRTNENR